MTGDGAGRASGAGSAAAAALVLALAAVTTGCGAPKSQALGGEVGREVQASIDSGRAAFPEDDWGALLAGGTRDGLVDYRWFQEHRKELDAYLTRVAGAHLASLAPAQLEALLIDAYNAYTIRTILQHPAVKSIRDIDGVWTDIRHRVGGHAVTLDDIEHRLLRPYFRDPRLHFALNCASRSCAPLPPWAYSGDSLDAQLDGRARAFLRDTANVRLDGGTLVLSKYFDWYGKDFSKPDWSPHAATIPLFVARYARPDVAAFIRKHDGSPPVRFLGYDWSLNAAVRPAVEGAGAAPARADSAAAGGSQGGGAARTARSGWVARLRGWVASLGPAGPVAYGAAYVLATVLFVPGSALTIGAGIAFGLVWGTVITSIASVTGASAAFFLARYLLRERVESWVEKRERFRLIDRAVGEEGWKIVALTRLSPLFPFNLLNYAYGLTGVGFRDYVLASWVAMLPGTLAYVWIGSAGAAVASAAAGEGSWVHTALQVLGVVATLGVAIVIGGIATRALRRKAGEPA